MFNKPMRATLPAADFDRAKAFYKDKLGVEPVEESEREAVYADEVGGFMVYPSQFAGTNKATAGGFEVDDLRSVVADLKGKGVEFMDFDYGPELRTVDGIAESPDSDELAAWFFDSEGNIIGIVQRV